MAWDESGREQTRSVSARHRARAGAREKNKIKCFSHLGAEQI